MYTRPLIIILTAILFCLEPIAKVLFFSLWTNVGLYTLLEYQFYKLSNLDFFLTFALLPLTGIALYMAKKWSYLFFIIVEIYMVSVHGNTFFISVYDPCGLPPVFNLLFFLLHLVVLSYFLMSNIRFIFLNTSLRFWETDPRYSSSIAVKVFCQGIEVGNSSQLVDISKSGAYISNISNIDVNSEILIKFTIGTDDFNLQARAIHKSKIRNIDGYGVKFTNINDIKKIQIALLVKTCSREGSPLRHEKDFLEKSLSFIINQLKKIIRSYLLKNPAK